MLELPPTLEDHVNNRLLQVRDFLNAIGVEEGAYAMIPFGRPFPPAAKIVMRIGKDRFDGGDYLAEIVIPSQQGFAAIMDVSDGKDMLAYLAAGEERLASLSPFDATQDAMIQDVPLPWFNAYDDGMMPREPEGFFASHRRATDDYALYYHERGIVTIIAVSRSKAMLELCYQCKSGIERTHLNSQLAPYRQR